MNKELISKENAVDIVQQFYNKVEDVPLKFLLSEVRCALLSAPPTPIDYKFDSDYTLACLKRAEQRFYESAGVPTDITSRRGHWVKIDNHRWKCSICGKETDLPHYDKAVFCFNCGTKMIEEILDET